MALATVAFYFIIPAYSPAYGTVELYLSARASLTVTRFVGSSNFTFGGFTPAISTYLIHRTGNKAMPGLWLSFAALCALMATLALTAQRAGVSRTVSRVGVGAT